MYTYNNTYLRISVANMNELSTIMVRVSSTESFENQNLLIQDFKHLDNIEEILYKTQSKQNIQNQQKYYTFIIIVDYL